LEFRPFVDLRSAPNNVVSGIKPRSAIWSYNL
jgi:hypothetical protein